MYSQGLLPAALRPHCPSCARSILPLVKTQVASQIKVRDLSRATVTASPAQFSSWNEARAELMVEAKKPLKVKSSRILACGNCALSAGPAHVSCLM